MTVVTHRGLYEPAASADAMQAGDLAEELRELDDVDVTVDLGGTLIDVLRASYDKEREKFVLHVHPDDVADVLRTLLRNEAYTGQAGTRSAGKDQDCGKDAD